MGLFLDSVAFAADTVLLTGEVGMENISPKEEISTSSPLQSTPSPKEERWPTILKEYQPVI